MLLSLGIEKTDIRKKANGIFELVYLLQLVHALH